MNHRDKFAEAVFGLMGLVIGKCIVIMLSAWGLQYLSNTLSAAPLGIVPYGDALRFAGMVAIISALWRGGE